MLLSRSGPLFDRSSTSTWSSRTMLLGVSQDSLEDLIVLPLVYVGGEWGARNNRTRHTCKGWGQTPTEWEMEQEQELGEQPTVFG